jgi:hypothetical protein
MSANNTKLMSKTCDRDSTSRKRNVIADPVAQSTSGLQNLIPDITRLNDTGIKLGPKVKTIETTTDTLTQSVSGLQKLTPTLTKLSMRLQTVQATVDRIPYVKCAYDTDRPLDGIISYFTQKHGGNVHDKGLITFASRSAFQGDSRALNRVANLTSDEAFVSKNETDQWVSWDFGKVCVYPTHYTIRAAGLRSWAIEGSMDGKRWKLIDKQSNYSDSPSRWTTISLAVSNSHEFRYLRLTQTAFRYGGDFLLALQAVEFFGTLSL